MPTICELQIEAKKRGLRGYSKLKKAELEALVNKKTSSPPKKAPTPVKKAPTPVKKPSTPTLKGIMGGSNLTKAQFVDKYVYRGDDYENRGEVSDILERLKDEITGQYLDYYNYESKTEAQQDRLLDRASDYAAKQIRKLTNNYLKKQGKDWKEMAYLKLMRGVEKEFNS